MGRVDLCPVSFNRAMDCSQFPEEIEGLILGWCKYKNIRGGSTTVYDCVPSNKHQLVKTLFGYISAVKNISSIDITWTYILQHYYIHTKIKYQL